MFIVTCLLFKTKILHVSLISIKTFIKIENTIDTCKMNCTKIHRYPIFSTRYSVMCKVYTGYCGTSEIEHGLCACTVDNPLAKARGLSLRTGAQTMLYLSHRNQYFIICMICPPTTCVNQQQFPRKENYFLSDNVYHYLLFKRKIIYVSLISIKTFRTRGP